MAVLHRQPYFHDPPLNIPEAYEAFRASIRGAAEQNNVRLKAYPDSLVQGLQLVLQVLNLVLII